MSDIKVLEQRALEIRRKYDKFEREHNREQWDAKKIARGLKKEALELMELIESGNTDSKEINHELGECLWRVLLVARKLDIDIERAFWTHMGELEQRLKDSTA